MHPVSSWKAKFQELTFLILSAEIREHRNTIPDYRFLSALVRVLTFYAILEKNGVSVSGWC